MAMQGLPRHGARMNPSNPLMVGVVRSGVLEVAPGFVVECGRTFVWWQVGRDRELARVVGAARASENLPARCVLCLSGWHEVMAFVSELELWTPPTKSAYARGRMRWLLRDPLR